MGCDKALLRLDGKTLLERAARSLAPHCEQVVISGRVVEGFASLPDIHPGDGPMGGLATIADYVDRQVPAVACVLLAPCDMPLVPAEAYRLLLDALERDRNALVAVASSDTRDFPLTAVYRREGLRRMAAAYAAGDRRVFGALQQLPWCRVTLPEAWLTNINTPDLFQKALAGE